MSLTQISPRTNPLYIAYIVEYGEPDDFRLFTDKVEAVDWIHQQIDNCEELTEEEIKNNKPSYDELMAMPVYHISHAMSIYLQPVPYCGGRSS